MTSDTRGPGLPTDRREASHQESGQRQEGPVDFAFLDTQTFGDAELQIEVLELFLTQARRLIPTLPSLSAKDQGDVAHLLKGSARGIGAWPFADEAAAFEATDASMRPALFQRLAAAFARAEIAILARLVEMRRADAPPKATI